MGGTTSYTRKIDTMIIRVRTQIEMDMQQLASYELIMNTAPSEKEARLAASGWASRQQDYAIHRDQLKTLLDGKEDMTNASYGDIDKFLTSVLNKNAKRASEKLASKTKTIKQRAKNKKELRNIRKQEQLVNDKMVQDNSDSDDDDGDSDNENNVNNILARFRPSNRVSAHTSPAHREGPVVELRDPDEETNKYIREYNLE